MNGVRPGHFRRTDDGRHIQVAVGTPRGSDADVFVGEPHVQRIFVGFRIHRHGLDAEFPARKDDAERDFAAVGDQNFF